MTDDEALKTLASEINACISKVETYQRKAQEFRITAGLRLQQAHDCIPRGQWGLWLKDNVLHDRKAVYRYLESVKRHDPVAQARKAEREKARWQQEKARQKQIVDPPEVARTKNYFRGLSWDQRGDFLKWIRQTGLY